jgi:hypothetical protein
VKKIVGPDLDKGEIQRYLSLVMMYPPILVNHASLEWIATSPRTVRMRDLRDPTNASVDLDIGEDGSPLCCRADRPRLVGKQSVTTPWSGICIDSREWEGLKVASRIEVTWHLPGGPFVYFRGELTSFTALR